MTIPVLLYACRCYCVTWPAGHVTQAHIYPAYVTLEIYTAWNSFAG